MLYEKWPLMAVRTKLHRIHHSLRTGEWYAVLAPSFGDAQMSAADTITSFRRPERSARLHDAAAPSDQSFRRDLASFELSGTPIQAQYDDDVGQASDLAPARGIILATGLGLASWALLIACWLV
jgi:hypothetical protein